MKAVVVRQHGGPDVLEVLDQPTPEPGPGQVRVDVAAAGVNFIDVYERSGAYRVPLPCVAGSEGAGTVSAVGPDVAGVLVGDRVAWAMERGGGYAEQVLVPAGRTVPVPDAVDDETAAAVVLQGLTAHFLTRSTFPVSGGDNVLVHAAAGGVGLLLTQLARVAGARVIATTSTPEKAQLAREAGASDVILYGNADVAAEVRRLTDGAGVAVVYDGVGQATFEASLDSLRTRGTMVLFGAASGPVPPVDPQVLNAKGSLFLTRPSLAHHIADRDELVWRAREVFDWVAAGQLSVRIGGRYPLADAREAQEDLAGRRSTGKLLVVP
jgi:NADPH:quinone reductase